MTPDFVPGRQWAAHMCTLPPPPWDPQALDKPGPLLLVREQSRSALWTWDRSQDRRKVKVYHPANLPSL